jgi:hydrogenase maturation factor
LGVISSGALLIAAAPAGSGGIVNALGKEGIASGVIGRFRAPGEGLWLESADGGRQRLPIFESDEITKIFD